MKESCGSCRFFATEKKECRRNAPKPVLTATGATWFAVWPTVDKNDWCGEYWEAETGSPPLPGDD